MVWSLGGFAATTPHLLSLELAALLFTQPDLSADCQVSHRHHTFDTSPTDGRTQLSLHNPDKATPELEIESQTFPTAAEQMLWVVRS